MNVHALVQWEQGTELSADLRLDLLKRRGNRAVTGEPSEGTDHNQNQEELTCPSRPIFTGLWSFQGLDR